MKTAFWQFSIVLALLTCTPDPAAAQAVAVTLRLDTNSIAVGATTHLHVMAQVLPVLRASADRIFSWYVDVLNTNGIVGSASYAQMQKTASDNDPALSSTGTTAGANRRGIYDTFLNLPGAGVTAPVELMNIPVTGGAPGLTRFAVQAGTGVPQMDSDFLVAPSGGGDPLTGADYSLAFADLQVTGTAPLVRPGLTIAVVRLSGGTNQTTLRWSLAPGQSYFLQYQDQLAPGLPWQTFPGGPHNSGSYVDNPRTASRVYRLLSAPGL